MLVLKRNIESLLSRNTECAEHTRLIFEYVGQLDFRHFRANHEYIVYRKKYLKNLEWILKHHFGKTIKSIPSHFLRRLEVNCLKYFPEITDKVLLKINTLPEHKDITGIRICNNMFYIDDDGNNSVNRGACDINFGIYNIISNYIPGIGTDFWLDSFDYSIRSIDFRKVVVVRCVNPEILSMFKFMKDYINHSYYSTISPCNRMYRDFTKINLTRSRFDNKYKINELKIAMTEEVIREYYEWI